MSKAKPKRRTRNDPRRIKTRLKLIKACEEIVVESGIGALTTVEVTRRAGVTQPAFYTHFKSMDECLEVTASQIVDRVTPLIAVLHNAVIIEKPPVEVVAMALQRIYEIAAAEGRFFEIFVRHRNTLSPLGRTVAKIPERAKTEVRAAFIRLARQMSVSDEFDREVELIADLSVLAVLGGMELLVTDPTRTPAEVAPKTARQILGLADGMMDELKRRSSSDSP